MSEGKPTPGMLARRKKWDIDDVALELYPIDFVGEDSSLIGEPAPIAEVDDLYDECEANAELFVTLWNAAKTLNPKDPQRAAVGIVGAVEALEIADQVLRGLLPNDEENQAHLHHVIETALSSIRREEG